MLAILARLSGTGEIALSAIPGASTAERAHRIARSAERFPTNSDRRFKTIEAIRRMASSVKAPVGVGPTHEGFAELICHLSLVINRYQFYMLPGKVSTHDHS